MPARGVTGYNHHGDEADFRHAPGQYGAIHFHRDDLEDEGGRGFTGGTFRQVESVDESRAIGEDADQGDRYQRQYCNRVA